MKKAKTIKKYISLLLVSVKSLADKTYRSLWFSISGLSSYNESRQLGTVYIPTSIEEKVWINTNGLQ